MESEGKSGFDKYFYRQLAILRQQIDAIPGECGQVLLEFLDNVAQHHREMQGDCSKVANLVDDLDLAVKVAQFNLWASHIDAKRGNPDNMRRIP